MGLFENRLTRNLLGWLFGSSSLSHIIPICKGTQTDLTSSASSWSYSSVTGDVVGVDRHRLSSNSSERRSIHSTVGPRKQLRVGLQLSKLGFSRRFLGYIMVDLYSQMGKPRYGGAPPCTFGAWLRPVLDITVHAVSNQFKPSKNHSHLHCCLFSWLIPVIDHLHTLLGIMLSKVCSQVIVPMLDRLFPDIKHI